ncbi:MAG: helix-turn-helix transcriptional regulator [Candidatus Caldatribacteriaceae bacterium]
MVPFILAALLRQPRYGYVLLEDLKALGLEVCGGHQSILYRMLRVMEREGLVTSSWDTEGPGPARRLYHITEGGRRFLQEWSLRVRQDIKVLERILEIIEKGG